MGMVTVAFSASGYGNDRRSFKTQDEAVAFIKNDVAEIADAHGGEVVDYGNGEWVVNSRSGEEIARYWTAPRTGRTDRPKQRS